MQAVEQQAERYYRRRANEELRRAEQAECLSAKVAHESLAVLFLRSVSSDNELFKPQQGGMELDMGEGSREQGFRLNGCR